MISVLDFAFGSSYFCIAGSPSNVAKVKNRKSPTGKGREDYG